MNLIISTFISFASLLNLQASDLNEGKRDTITVILSLNAYEINYLKGNKHLTSSDMETERLRMEGVIRSRLEKENIHVNFLDSACTRGTRLDSLTNWQSVILRSLACNRNHLIVIWDVSWIYLSQFDYALKVSDQRSTHKHLSTATWWRIRTIMYDPNRQKKRYDRTRKYDQLGVVKPAKRHAWTHPRFLRDNLRVVRKLIIAYSKRS